MKKDSTKGYFTFCTVALWVTVVVIQGIVGEVFQSPGFNHTSIGFQDFYIIFALTLLAYLVITAVVFTTAAGVNWLKTGFRALQARAS